MEIKIEELGLVKICEKLYINQGRGAVLKLADNLLWRNWKRCASCEALVPVYDDACLVCGGSELTRESPSERAIRDEIENFICYWTSQDEERVKMCSALDDYEITEGAVEAIVNAK